MRDINFRFDVAEELRKIRGINSQYEISKISRISKHPQNNSIYSAKDKLKISEIEQLIRSYARYWGENEELINEYIADQLKAYSLDELYNCFKLLSADIQKK